MEFDQNAPWQPLRSGSRAGAVCSASSCLAEQSKIRAIGCFSEYVHAFVRGLLMTRNILAVVQAQATYVGILSGPIVNCLVTGPLRDMCWQASWLRTLQWGTAGRDFASHLAYSDKRCYRWLEYHAKKQRVNIRVLLPSKVRAAPMTFSCCTPCQQTEILNREGFGV